MSLARRLMILALFSAPLTLAACKQGVGDRCQVASDCDDGLVCVLSGATAQAGGTCQVPGGGVDASGAADMATGGGSDGGTNTDL